MNTHTRCMQCRNESGYIREHPLLCDDCGRALKVPNGVDRLAFEYGYAAALWGAFMLKRAATQAKLTAVRAHEEPEPAKAGDPVSKTLPSVWIWRRMLEKLQESEGMGCRMPEDRAAAFAVWDYLDAQHRERLGRAPGEGTR